MTKSTTQLFKISFTVIMEGARGETVTTLEVSEEQLVVTLEAIKASRFVVQSTIKIQQQ